MTYRVITNYSGVKTVICYPNLTATKALSMFYNGLLFNRPDCCCQLISDLSKTVLYDHYSATGCLDNAILYKALRYC